VLDFSWNAYGRPICCNCDAVDYAGSLNYCTWEAGQFFIITETAVPKQRRSRKNGPGRAHVADALRARIVTGLHIGRFAGGDKLPSARGLASEFGVNERVVLAALRMLAEEGFLEIRTRSGTYVKPAHPAGEGVLPDLGAWIVRILIQARSRGLPPKETSHYLRRSLETRRVRAACIECNRDQLHLLCSELTADYGLEAESTELADLDRSDSLLRADILVTTLFHATEVQAVARRLRKPCVSVTLRADVMEQIGDTLRKGLLYYVATDERFEKKLPKMLETLGPTKNLRVVLLGRDNLEHIPPDAPTYIMSSAREQLLGAYGPAGGPGHPIHPPRIFSDESARELLTMLVRANSAALKAGLAS
jgi:DNA-binding transcriptional regulator YhcF (GntR family)